MFVTTGYQVSTTVESEAEASRLAEALVAERLAGCVQVQGPLQSTYRWEGAVTRATEWLCTVKTVEARLEEVMTRIRMLHSYQQPEIIATPIAAGDPGYLGWLEHETSREGS